MRMKFRFMADIEFESENVETATLDLAAHFVRIAREFSSEDMPAEQPAWYLGSMELGPKDSTEWKE